MAQSAHLSEHELYEANNEYLNDIIRSIAQSQPFISPAFSSDVVLAEVRSNEKFYKKACQLKKGYEMYRAVRRDGSCFYRSLLFCLFEQLLVDRKECERILALIKSSLDLLVSIGYDRLGLEDFYDLFVEELQFIYDGKSSKEDIEKKFNDQYISDYLVTYGRYLTSYYLQANQDLFQYYLPEGVTIKSFVATEVEPPNKDADYVQCSALTSFLKCGVRVEYVDQSDGPLNAHTFPDSTIPSTVFLLYRPGHYDIIYPIKTNNSVTNASSASASSSS